MSDEARARSRRLFLALWPSADLRSRIVDESSLAIERSSGRSIAARNLHITLLFLGEVAASKLEAVIAAAASIARESFTIAFDHVETWPGSNVLCLTSSHPPASMSALSEALRCALIVHGFELRKQAFRPHITLARDVPRMRSTESITPLSWPVEDFVLVESNMTKAGSEYSVIERWPLAASTSAETR